MNNLKFILFKSNPVKYLLVFSLFLGFTIILTYPVTFLIGTHIPGGGDTFGWMGSLYYNYYAIFNLDITSLTYNNLVFYPDGIPRTPFPSFYNQVVAFFLLFVLPLPAVYSIIWLISFPLAGFGTYLLTNHLTKSNIASIFAGFIFAFSPFHFIHSLGHLGATSIQWIPFSVLGLIIFREKKNFRNAIIAAFSIFLVFSCDIQLALFFGFFIILWIINEIIREYKEEGFAYAVYSVIKSYLPVGIISGLLSLPLFFQELLITSSGSNYLKVSSAAAAEFSADLFSFLLPSVLHPLFGKFTAPYYAMMSGNNSEHTMFLGYSVIILSLIGIWYYRKDNEVRFWTVIFAFFSLLSLGPILHILGKTTFTDLQLSIPLPHLILYNLIPVVENCRTTGRFFTIASLAIAILAGYGVLSLYKISLKKKYKNIFITILFCILVFEFASSIKVVEVPQIPFYEKLGEEKDLFAIMEVPSTDYSFVNYASYFQTIHHKPRIGGHSARLPSHARDLDKYAPVISVISNIEIANKTRDIIQLNNFDGKAILQNLNIRYIIIHPNFMSQDKTENLLSYLNATMNITPTKYDEDSLIVYEIPKKERMNYGITRIIDGFYSPELGKDKVTRWMKNDGKVVFHSENSGEILCNMTLASYDHPRNLSIMVNEELVLEKSIDTKKSSVSFLFHSIEGDNAIIFQTEEECSIPSMVTKSNDNRCLSLRFWNITFSNKGKPSELITNNYDSTYYSINSIIDFTKWGNSEPYCSSGWSWQENDYKWTDGHEASLNLNLDTVPERVVFSLNAAYAFIGPDLDNQTVLVSINDKNLDTIVIDDKPIETNLPIPTGYLIMGSNKIEFTLPNATSPQELGVSEDDRTLGIAVRSIRLFEDKKK